MPWTSIKDVSPALKAIEPAVTLRQANQIALWADRMEASDVEGAWPMAIRQFKRLYTVTERGWTRIINEGGPGSGNWGHAGIKGSQGGSAAGGGLAMIGAPLLSTKDERAEAARAMKLGRQASKTAETLMMQLFSQGGFTYDAVGESSPKTGYMVSPFKDREFVKDMDEMTSADLRDYVLDNADLISKDEHYLGGWADKGKAYIDISIRRESKAEALALAKQYKQLAI